jgi:Kef-type K+ transport system membrane component KefB
MTAIAILLFAAAIAFGLSKLLRLPSIPLLMLAGATLTALAKYQAVVIPQDLVREMIEIGLAVLVFTAGVELSPRRIRGQRGAVTILALSQFRL